MAAVQYLFQFGFVVAISVAVFSVTGRIFRHSPIVPVRRHPVKGVLSHGQNTSLASCGPNSSSTRLEMELLLLNLDSVATKLIEALATELELGDRLFVADVSKLVSLEEWMAARDDVRSAQTEYDRAVADYRLFVASLAPPLRAEAAARAIRPMALTAFVTIPA